MIDVHPPDTKMHGIGDFFLHLFTITCGLLIALALEGLVERHQKTELKEAAEASLRQEVQDNRKALLSVDKVTQDEEDSLKASLAFLNARKLGKPYDVGKIALASSTTLSDASWRTATATGALALIRYDKAQKYAQCYQVQEEYLRLQRDTLDDFLLLQSHIIYGFDPSKVTPADAVAAEPDVARTLAHLVALSQYSHGLQQSYDQALKP